ncbi:MULTISPECIES: sulfate ABC transporter permease subunit CysT [unclassified Enterococcus]|uniref:sulfate ABC transporter permease subunit CysT n=1 Tax=unclassified Enterococcus TaxID=2608891 RepID=UPI001554BF48|nr:MULTISPECIES: sulfate ABC transporter permease subunit CysT [unclassified Enterococcus]MBS7576396.1 sulfate ABC transporter permease subunit CysT [Enterococcus sp. MMGLQ5-2]MBS7583628.1 sulfate ABC transporter permease subunit CysT [Enterococcus sp. MMGLQ5-1]NPD11489.1 sulfate ABC transporter permease subunit CysT [Enterococcus sp. MMGLQ5-1]NPD36233.1 sulfate ABC transporter permease subunit CysT [Enterococcus sp. MMGLQ5-2]
MRFSLKKNRVVPGFGISLGITMTMISLIILIPMISIFLQTSKIGIDEFWRIAMSKRVVLSYLLSVKTAFFAALINTVFGLILAWVLVRYSFFGKRFIDGLVELPFALPTAVAGISLANLYSDKGFMGQLLLHFGIKVSYTELGILVAMTFVTIPFVVREVQPVLAKLDPIYEEAASVMGATPFQIFSRIIFPELKFPLFIGFSLAFARSMGEYGSVVFIAGNQPFKTEIPSLLIASQLNEHSYSGATAIALVLLIFSFLVMIVINLIQHQMQRFVR